MNNRGLLPDQRRAINENRFRNSQSKTPRFNFRRPPYEKE